MRRRVRTPYEELIDELAGKKDPFPVGLALAVLLGIIFLSVLIYLTLG